MQRRYTAPVGKKKATKKKRTVPEREREIPIKHWSHSSLMSYLRNPLAWYKRYVEKVYDAPQGPAGIVGRAGHIALENFYGGMPKDSAIQVGLDYLRGVPDFEVNFGKWKGKRMQKKKRELMERDYLQAIAFYLERAPRYKVLGIEVVATAEVPGLLLPIKAVSDLVVESKGNPGCVDIVDHKFVDSFSPYKAEKTLFIVQSLFNYYTIGSMFGKPIKRFILHECKKRKNKDGSAQVRKYVIDFEKLEPEFAVFHRLINDTTEDMMRRRVFLPNPSDMFEGEHSFDIYRLGLID